MKKILNNYKSPNFDNREINTKIKFIILHYTETKNLKDTLEILCSKKKKVSCHYIVDLNGDIYEIVDVTKRAWHAGVSFWKNLKNLNNNSIGIEIVNSGERSKKKYPKEQINCLIKLIKKLKEKYKVSKNNILAHSDIAPLRKIDPGIFFPWKKLSKMDIGIWYDLKLSKKENIIRIKNKELYLFHRNLKKIGFSQILINKSFHENFHVINAFHRHFNITRLNMEPSYASYLISENLVKNKRI